MTETDDLSNNPDGWKSAEAINAYTQQVIQEMWLATHVLVVHLEIEKMLEEALRQTLPNPSAFLKKKGLGPSFSQKLVFCESLEILDKKLVLAIYSLNRLRNSFAHSRKQDIEAVELCKFLWGTFDLIPFVPQHEDGEEVRFESYEQLKLYFENNPENLEGLTYVSLRMLQARFSTMFSDTPPEKLSND